MPIDDSWFDADFEVFTNADDEAQTLITQEFVNRINAFDSKFGRAGIELAFYGSDLIIVVRARNLFEIKSIDPKNDRENVELIIEQFAALAELVAYLRGNKSDYLTS